VILNCQHCGKIVADIELAKIRNDAVMLCKECWQLIEGLMEVARSQKNRSSKDLDFLTNLFGMKK
jgi:protein-arginine kinase activator protein McsA